jgi:thioredoxin-like negative regulator of GroEL
LVAVSFAIALTFALPSRAAAPAAGSGIAWQVASTDGDVDRAFALARREGKPLFFYWGAVWCPPCNQVKATLFSRPEFVERSHTFVAVYVDGDRPGAQKVAARFKVTGYPTMVLFKPDGTEITRLPGEVDPERYLLTLTAGLESQTSVKELASAALSHEQLSTQQWRLLAFYSWDADEQQIFKAAELRARLSELAAAAPPGPIRVRLALKAVAARAQEDSPTLDERSRVADRALVVSVLSDPSAVMEQRDLLILFADPLLKYLSSDADSRAAMATKWDAALSKLTASAALSRIDLLDLLDARVELWKAIDRSEILSRDRRDAARSGSLGIVAQTTDKYERQAVVPSAAHVLASAGLLADSDELLKSELPRAISPYYHMLGIAANAKKRGDNREALRWYEEAWLKAEGSATRLQWGVSYLREVIALAPSETGRVASAASAIVSELEPKGETFFERNERSLQKMAGYLQKWEGSDAAREKVVAQIRRNLSLKCARLPKGDAGRINCESVFTSAMKSHA